MATRTISTKLAVEGEAAYKASLKNINSELGTLKSELKLVESEFAGQANSYEALSAKGEVLSKMYDAQEGKVSKLKEALENARKAQQTYTDRVSEAQKNIERCEAALAALGEQSGDTSEEQARLTAELESYKRELSEAESYQEAATRSVNSWQSQVNSAQSELNKLASEIDDNNRYMDEAKNSSDGLAESINELGKAVDLEKKAQKEAKEAAEKHAEKMEKLGTVAKATTATIAAFGAAAVAGVKLLLDLEESTEEYRIAQGKLNTAFEAAGYSTDTASEAYKSFYGILGDTDAATESAQLLAQLATSEKDVATWADIAAGVTGTFGDALPINSFVEAANETAKVGTVTGALADALNWVGISEDEFNEKLAACASEEERTALITETLAKTYEGATEAFKKNNETIIAANLAQAELDDTLARLGGTVADVKTELTAEFLPAIADVVDAFVDLLEGAEGAEEALSDSIDALVGQAADKLPELLDFGGQIVISLVEGIVNAIPSLTEGAVAVVMALAEQLVILLPQIVGAGVQMLAAIVQGIAEALPTLIPAAVSAITQLCITLVENLPLLIEAALQLVTGLATGIIEAIPILLEALPVLIESLVTTLLAAIPQIIETGITLLVALVEALPTIIETIIAVLPQIIESVISTLLSHLPEIVEAGVELLTALVTNLPEIILTIIGALPEIISSITDTLIDNIPKIVETGVKLLTSLITDLPSIIVELVRAMPEIISSMVGALAEGVSAFAQVGVNLVQGLWSGIQSLAGWLWDKVSAWISSIWDGICDFFGIASPSKKMEWVSEMNVEGAVVGVDKNKQKAVNAYGEMGEEMLAEVESEMGKVNAALADSIGEIETSFNASATISQVEAALPSVMPGGGGAGAEISGGTTITNHFEIASLVVREEADVKKISRELYNMQKSKSRGKGVVMA